ncbi:MAG: hypothetical protein ABWY45_17355 [Mycobacterium sp.]
MTGPAVDSHSTITIDAFTGAEPVRGHFAANYRQWALAKPYYGRATMRPDPPDPRNWRDDRVGWGIVLPERPGMSPAELAGVGDAAPAIQELVSVRGGKVLRYRAGVGLADWTLRNYAQGDEFFTPAAAVGMGPQELPKYLLINATPSEVPWYVQFTLNPVRYVGRLDLTGLHLDNYVQALLTDWTGAGTAYSAPVVWAVEHSGNDITALMRDTVAAPVYAAFRSDDEMTAATFLDGRTTPATVDTLCTALETNRPALVVTSSHGMTGPLSDLGAMRANLGLPVGQSNELLAPDTLMAKWQPDGAIWFAQACCSAGSDSPTSYAGLFEAGSTLDTTLTAIARAGAGTAPLPRALLGAAKPARAFIGHVEPTFNWTLEFPDNRQVLTADLTTAIYEGLAGGDPVGMALSDYYRAIAALLQNYEKARRDYNATVGDAAKGPLDSLVYCRVTAHDRASTVILGDPTAAIVLPNNNATNTNARSVES